MNIDRGSFLPVTQLAVSRALTEIAANPTRAMMSEGEIIIKTQPGLNSWVHLKVDRQNENPSYYEGVSWSHMILRTQAELNGSTLPTVTAPIIGNYSRARADQIRNSATPDMNVGDLYTLLYANLSAQEPILGEAIAETAKYRPFSDALYGGAIETYLLLKAAQEAAELERRFNI